MTTNDSSLDALSREERRGLERARRIAHFLDRAVTIPGTSYRIGVDGIVGIVPIVGDWLTGLCSLYIVLEARRLGASNAVLGRMVLNLGIDSLIGSIPVLGDLFDVAWKANLKNVDLLERHLDISS